MAMIRPETEMKDSGVQWLGNVPKEWSVGKVKHEFYATKTIVGDKVNDYERLALTLNGVIKRSKDAGDGLQPEKFDGYQILKEHELVFKLIDLANVSTSRVGLSPYTGIVSPAYIVLHHRKDMNPRYGEYYFLSMWMNEVFNHIGGDGVRSALNAKDLLNIPYLKVSSDEQQAIADYLDETCSKIDEIIAEAKASIDEYKELKQSVIFEAVTKGLDKNVEMKDSGVKAIGKVNNKYNVVKIAELNDGLTDGTHGTYKRFDSGKLLLSSKNVQHNGLVIGSNESYISEEDSNAIVANGFPQKDDLLLCCIGASIGRCILYPFDYPIAFQRSVIFIRCNKWILPKMMMYNLQSISSLMQEQMVVNVSAQAGLYQGLVKQLYIVVPPIDEQKQIILLLDKKQQKLILSLLKRNLLSMTLKHTRNH